MINKIKMHNVSAFGLFFCIVYIIVYSTPYSKVTPNIIIHLYIHATMKTYMYLYDEEPCCFILKCYENNTSFNSILSL